MWQCTATLNTWLTVVFLMVFLTAGFLAAVFFLAGAFLAVVCGQRDPVR